LAVYCDRPGFFRDCRSCYFKFQIEIISKFILIGGADVANLVICVVLNIQFLRGSLFKNLPLSVVSEILCMNKYIYKIKCFYRNYEFELKTFFLIIKLLAGIKSLGWVFVFLCAFRGALLLYFAFSGRSIKNKEKILVWVIKLVNILVNLSGVD
jgi:hypothetical protein